MPIRCVCPNGHALRVKDKLAGRQGVCPKCGADFAIPALSPLAATAAADPAATDPPSSAPPSSATQATPSEEADLAASQPTAPQPAASLPAASETETSEPVISEPEVEWRIASPEGEQYGPATNEVFQKWIVEGRVQTDWLVWRTGWPDWRKASEAAEELPATLPETPPAVPGATAPGAAVTGPTALEPTALGPVSKSVKRQKPSTPESPDLIYNRRKKLAATRRRSLIAVLAIVCLGLATMLVWLLYFR